MKVKYDYVWLDGYKPEPNLRSKVKIIEVNSKEDLENIPEWGFDGSSTKQAEGHFSDCYLKPVRGYVKSSISEYCTVYVLCEVLNSDGKSHETNDRAKLGKGR
jgi:glutamine synthetase